MEGRLEMAVNSPRPDTKNVDPVKLTRREIEVLQLVLEGKSSKEVADELVCSKRTVDFHINRIYDKLDVSNRVQAMLKASTLGLIAPGKSQ